MKPTREYVSPDNQLRFVVDHDEQDVSLGFEGFPWHTHANVLASEFGTSEELAVNRFVRDLLSDRSILVVSRVGGTIPTFGSLRIRNRICVTSLMTKSLSIGIGAAGSGSPPNKSSQPTRPAAGGFLRDRRAGPT